MSSPKASKRTESTAGSLEELKKWLVGRKIVGIKRLEHILDLQLDDKTHLIVYTETFAKGLENA